MILPEQEHEHKLEIITLPVVHVVLGRFCVPNPKQRNEEAEKHSEDVSVNQRGRKLVTLTWTSSTSPDLQVCESQRMLNIQHIHPPVQKTKILGSP